MHHSKERIRSEVYSNPDKDGSEDHSRSESNRGVHRRGDSKHWGHGVGHERHGRTSSGGRNDRGYDRDSSGRQRDRDSSSRQYDREYNGDHDRKRSRYEGYRRTPGKKNFLTLNLSSSHPKKENYLIIKSYL